MACVGNHTITQRFDAWWCYGKGVFRLNSSDNITCKYVPLHLGHKYSQSSDSGFSIGPIDFGKDALNVDTNTAFLNDTRNAQTPHYVITTKASYYD